jgi:hypothetical protein
VARHREAERGVVAGDALDDERRGQRVGAPAADVLRERDSEEAERPVVTERRAAW